MRQRLKEFLAFTCPMWDELPEIPLFNHEVVDYINQTLSPIILEENPITPTMIQNYSKWGVIPKLRGRKYDRRQISCLIIISVYKQVINISDIKEGIKLQLKLGSLEEGYNIFASSLNSSIRRIFKAVLEEEKILLDGYQVEKGREGVEAIMYAFTLKLLGTSIIRSGGFASKGV